MIPHITSSCKFRGLSPKLVLSIVNRSFVSHADTLAELITILKTNLGDRPLNLLDEGVYVQSGDNESVGFGRKLKNHLRSHGTKDAENRKRRLLFAIDTVRSAHPETNHKGIEGRKAYAKRFDGFGMLVLTDKGGKEISEVFTIIPKRNKKRMEAK